MTGGTTAANATAERPRVALLVSAICDREEYEAISHFKSEVHQNIASWVLHIPSRSEAAGGCEHSGTGNLGVIALANYYAAQSMHLDHGLDPAAHGTGLRYVAVGYHTEAVRRAAEHAYPADNRIRTADACA